MLMQEEDKPELRQNARDGAILMQDDRDTPRISGDKERDGAILMLMQEEDTLAFMQKVRDDVMAMKLWNNGHQKR